MPTIGFLHTSPVHAPTFEALVADVVADRPADVDTVTVVDAELLGLARLRGADHADVRTGLERALAELNRRGASVVVCTCSTIGDHAERVGLGLGRRVVRVDRAMAEAAVAVGGRIAVVVAVESTVGPTRALIEAIAEQQGTSVEIQIVVSDGAWAEFEAGAMERYLALVAQTCVEAASTADVVVLAQASMADAVHRFDATVPVLSSPRRAVQAAVDEVVER